MKVAIIGRSQFLYSAALWLLKQGSQIPLLITAPASPEYTKKEVDFQKLAKDINARYFLSNSLNDGDMLSAMEGLDIGGIDVKGDAEKMTESIKKMAGKLGGQMGKKKNEEAKKKAGVKAKKKSQKK